MFQTYNFIISDTLFWWINAGSAFFISCILTSIVIPQILLIAFRKRLFDPLNDRKLHQKAIPRLGGIAFNPILVFSIIFLLGINLILGKDEIAISLGNSMPELAFGLCAGLFLYLTGIVDDLIGVRYRTKFIVQILSGIMLASSGLWINNLHGLFGIETLPPFPGYLLTVVVVVFIINAINLIDGIDGLASGLSGIALIYYGIVFMQYELYIYALLSFASLGTIVPFFYYNVFGNAKRGRKLFMGDTGSLTIGIILSILSIATCMHSIEPSNSMNPFVIAFTPLIVPCFDVLRVFLHRLRNKRPPFAPDKNHIHHKLLATGICQHKTLVCILTASVVITVANIYYSLRININLLLLANILIWTLANIWLTSIIIKKSQKKKYQKKKESIETSTHYAN